MIVWCDLETTGLCPDQNSILEIAAIVTDDKLNEVARFERVVAWDGARDMVWKMDGKCEVDTAEYPFFVDPFVYEMHKKNGLWRESADSNVPLWVVDDAFEAFLDKYAVQSYERNVAAEGEEPRFETRIDAPQLAGSTISFDRSFLAAHMPNAYKKLHYRSIDVSSFNETGRRFWPDIWKSRPRKAAESAHRGMADIQESLDVYKHYLGRLGDTNVIGW